MIVVLWVLAVLAAVPAGLRWLRIAQREHYLPGAGSRFAGRWWRRTPNQLLISTAAIGLVVSAAIPAAGVATMSVVAAGPMGLSVRGTTSPLRWTARLRRLALIFGTVWALVLLGGGLVGAFLLVALAACLLLPVLLDVALWLAQPLERRLSRRYVEMATEKLAAIDPVVVGVTGSYGKTSTKQYVAAILGPHRGTVASPASFNNEMGLARAINEGLTPGAEVFIAEMGTYGPGEIKRLCGWIQPSVGVITSIGPVHLERFGSLETTLAAKAEILEGVDKAVLNVDDDRLAELASTSRMPVVRCSTLNPDADVHVSVGDGETLAIHVAGRLVDEAPARGLFPTNVACAVGVAVALDVPLEGIGSRLAGLPAAPHRREVTRSENGFTIVDDTFNSNPAGARAALDVLAEHPGRLVVVTPGMVELGSEQAEENRSFAAAAADLANDVVIVGHTNRKALKQGTAGGTASVKLVGDRPEAVAWVRTQLGEGDAVLYENDLPDHYP